MNTDREMQPLYDTLNNMLRAESSCGFRNTGVIGGLDKMIPLWEAHARNSNVSADFAGEVTTSLRNYPSLSIDERQVAVRKMAKLLESAAEDRRTVPSPGPEGPRKRKQDSGVNLDSPLTVIHGIGLKQSERLKKLGLERLRDPLYLYPHRYVDYSALKPINRLQYDEELTVIGTIKETHLQRAKGGRMHIVRTLIGDGTGEIECSWFNQPWLEHQLRSGRQIQVSGRTGMYLGRLVFTNPEWEELDRSALHTGRIVPMHSLTKGISAKNMRRWMHTIIEYVTPYVRDPLPEELRERLELSGLEDALRNVHFPNSQEHLSQARRRLAFDELLMLQLGMRLQRAEWQAIPGQPLVVGDKWLHEALAALPFTLTGAQQRALGEVCGDLVKDVPMNRLLQGDVGSGKTVIAALAIAVAVRSGLQGALMAPTSVLAEQHYLSVRSLLQVIPGLDLGGDELPAVCLLQGSTSPSERATIAAGLRNGSIKVLIGTHALIQGAVKYNNLGVAVVDEQHRFGVAERAALRGKGDSPHLLVMTATPIPRSLALTVHGDLDVTIIDELPPGRQPVETRVIYPGERERAYTFVRSQVSKGRQIFIIYPLVEESSRLQAKAAVDEHARLQEDIFPSLRLGLLHGRIKPAERNDVMAAFRRGELDVLVATSVIEVGVDVPNASVMLIEGANRFGLAQLHQFRGRVGRGEHKSFCMLVSEGQSGHRGAIEDKSDRRLRIMETVSDGFALAEKDLELRGPGEFMGTRQAGYTGLRLARLTDLHLVHSARREADRLFSEDPNFTKPEHKLLAEQVHELWSPVVGDAD